MSKMPLKSKAGIQMKDFYNVFWWVVMLLPPLEEQCLSLWVSASLLNPFKWPQQLVLCPFVQGLQHTGLADLTVPFNSVCSEIQKPRSCRPWVHSLGCSSGTAGGCHAFGCCLLLSVSKWVCHSLVGNCVTYQLCFETCISGRSLNVSDSAHKHQSRKLSSGSCCNMPGPQISLDWVFSRIFSSFSVLNFRTEPCDAPVAEQEERNCI